MWTISTLPDPLNEGNAQEMLHTTKIMSASCPLRALFPLEYDTFQEGGRVGRVALADFLARHLSDAKLEIGTTQFRWELLNGPVRFRWELLSGPAQDTAKVQAHHGRRHWQSSRKTSSVPYVLERSDIWASSDQLHLQLRVFVEAVSKDNEMDGIAVANGGDLPNVEEATYRILKNSIVDMDHDCRARLMNHVAVCVLQDKLRRELPTLNAVAFISNGAILPRKSGASNAPMSSPPAVPFEAPVDSPMQRTVEISMGKLRPFLRNSPNPAMMNGHIPSPDVVALTGLLITRGVSLIVGGGYHGKSTLLRTIAAGVYNKIPNDGREFCVTMDDAVAVRAEDGRYVNNCNVSAFISNLPTPPGVTIALDTSHFSTREASGSTSQASNVVEAIEMGCSALLVDEDVSAANFMARDGRMRSLVMDESITPLLYRVNGLFQTHGISSIVVVGGVGDWLDVPDQVILMDKYLCRDATQKARSVSRQFSHGYVQYGGRGVVHRLDWDVTGTPIPRRPVDSFAALFHPHQTDIVLLEGHNAFALLREISDGDHEEMDDEAEDGHFVDLSRCEQLMGKKAQLYGCGLCVLWILDAARRNPQWGVRELLNQLDRRLDEDGFASLLVPRDMNLPAVPSTAWRSLVELIGCAYRPRRFEVGQALTRLRGIKFEEVPQEEDMNAVARAAAAEEERKKRELLELWNSRRNKKNADTTDN